MLISPKRLPKCFGTVSVFCYCFVSHVRASEIKMKPYGFTSVASATLADGPKFAVTLENFASQTKINSSSSNNIQATIALHAIVACGVSLSNAAQRIHQPAVIAHAQQLQCDIVWPTGHWKPRLLCGSHTGCLQLESVWRGWRPVVTGC